MTARDRIAAATWLIVRDSQAAEDIFQNVAVKAMTRDVNFDSEGAVLSWSLITARREGIDWLRRRRSESTIIDADILQLLEKEWLSEIRQQDPRSDALRSCLQELPANSYELLKLRYFDGLACAKVAERLGTGLDAVYKRLSRVHQLLKKCVQRRHEDALEAGT